MSTKHAHCLTV